MRRFILLSLIFLLSSYSFSDSNEERNRLKLVYKDIGKPPYMQKYPDNSGLYAEMMKIAANRIGFDLDIIREPKKRTYFRLENGDVDLYASGEFRDYRSEFLYYFPNGLFRSEQYYGLTLDKIPNLTSVSQIKDHKLVWLVELGSSWPLQAQKFGVDYYETSSTRIEKAVQLFELERDFFFQITRSEIEAYEKSNPSLKSLGIKVHKQCCANRKAPLYSSFSRFSPWYQEQKNSLYDPKKPLSAENFPMALVPNSVPDKFKRALQDMIDSGEIIALKKKYGVK